jgi:hypothetical protein
MMENLQSNPNFPQVLLDLLDLIATKKTTLIGSFKTREIKERHVFSFLNGYNILFDK